MGSRNTPTKTTMVTGRTSGGDLKQVLVSLFLYTLNINGERKELLLANDIFTT